MIARSDTGDRERPCTDGEKERKGRVVVIDDHVVFRQALVVMLEKRAGLDVCAEAGSPAEARDTLAAMAIRPDLVILDLDLHALGAQNLMRELCDNLPDTGVIGLTAGRHRVAVPEKARVLGTDVPVDEILAAARRLVG